MHRPLAVLLASGLLVSACGSGEEPKDQPPPPKGRAETQSIRNTEAVGVGGNAIADQVDQAIDTTRQRKEQQDREVEEQAP